MLQIKSVKKPYGINFPTEVAEVTPEILNEITANVKLPKHYAILALCFKTKVFDFVTTINSSKEVNISVTPLLAKIADDDSENVNAVVGDKVIIDRSSLERGVHLNLPTLVSSNNARRYFKEDPELSRAIMTKDSNAIQIDKNMSKSLLAANSPQIIVLEFKIVPVTDIAASIAIGCNSVDPFEIKDLN